MTRLTYFIRETVISLRRNLLMTIAGIITVAVSLFLFGGSLLAYRMVDRGTEAWKDVKFEVFMNVDATDEQIADVRTALESDPDVVSFEFLTKQMAYAEFKEIFADQPALVESTTPEALPVSFRVVPADAELTETVSRRYLGRPGVHSIITAQEIIERILDVTRWIRIAFVVLATSLLASALFLIMNTIRLATFARRREIEVMKLVGASNSFVRIPFMAEGVVQGAIGAGFAVGLVYLLKAILSDFVEGRSDGLWRDFFLTNGDVLLIGFWVIAIGAVIGVIGSAIGLRRFLDA
jgi:cell division transport system permease protein